MMREWATLIQRDPVVGSGIRLIVERANVRENQFGSWALWLEKIECILQQAKDKGELLPGSHVQEIAQFVAEGFTGIQLVSAAATQYVDFLERFDRLWKITATSLISPTVSQEFYSSLAQPERFHPRLNITSETFLHHDFPLAS